MTALRIESPFVLASALIILSIGLVCWKLPTPAAMMVASSLVTLLVVFALGYRPTQSGDISWQQDLKLRLWQSESEWTESYGQQDPLLGWSNQPNAVAQQVHRDFTVTYHLDSDGWRRLPMHPASAAAPEIWFLGCSFTFGVGVEDADVYPYRLAATAWPGVQVRNFSVPGWGTAQAYLKLKEQLERRPPPRAVVYGWINHHRMRNYLRRSWFARTHATSFPYFEIEDGQPRWNGVVSSSRATLEDGPELDEAEYRVTDALIRAMARLSRERDIPFVILPLDPTDQRILDSVRGEPGLHILDVSNVSTALHPNDGHPTAVWHQAVARAIAADPLLSEVTGLPQLHAADAIADPPMRKWQLSVDPNSPQQGKAAIRYPVREDGMLRVEFSGLLPDDPWKTVLKRTDLRVKAGRAYEFKVRIRSDSTRALPFTVGRGRAPWGDLGLRGELALSPRWQTIQRTFVASDDDAAAWLMLVVGGSPHAVEIEGEPTLSELSDSQAAAALAQPTWKLAAAASTGALLAHLAVDQQPPFRVDLKSLPDNDIWTVQAQLDRLSIHAGQEYTFELRARSPSPRQLQYALSRSQPDWENLGLWGEVELTPAWQTVRTSFIANRDEPAGRLILALGASTESVEVADVRLIAGDQDLLPRQ